MLSKLRLCSFQSTKFAGEMVKIVWPTNEAGGVCQSLMTRSGSGKGRDFNTTAFTTVKMAVFTPMPSPRMTIAAMVNAGLFLRPRRP